MSKARVEDQFGPSAHDYAMCEVHAAGKSLARMLELSKPQKHWRAIDIGTGAGHTAALFAPHVEEVIATDITAEMLLETEKLKAARNLQNLTTARAEATAIPYPGDAFDLVTCRLAAHHFLDPGGFVSECARVLKPGGTFVLVDNIVPDRSSLPECSRTELAQAALDYNAFEGERDPSHARALSALEWVEICKGRGLQIEAQEVMAKEMGFDAWVERMRCDERQIQTLRRTLRGNSPLAAFLLPREIDGKLHFSLRELILIARKVA